MLLKDKICLITGAASKRGIGRATAHLFAEEGATIGVLDLDADLAQDCASTLGPTHRAYACNVTSRDDCQRAAAQALADFGHIDILINIAGISQPIKVMEIEPENYDAVTDVNLRGTLYMSQAVIPAMRKQKSGSIVCMGSVSAQRGGGIFGGPHYSAAKAGIMGLAKAMARELGPDGIRVNSVAPGLIDTDITEGKLVGQLLADIEAGIPMGRVGQPIDVARVCLFLASDLSSYVTGSVVDVNGGMLIHA